MAVVEKASVRTQTKGGRMITVIHNSRFTDFSFMEESEIQAEAAKLTEAELTKAAVVHTDSLEDAFRLTNNIDSAWTDNEGVSPTFQSRRSTSVGDIMTKDGKRFMVASVGFVELAA